MSGLLCHECSAGSEALEDPVHDQDSAVSDTDQDGRVSARHAVVTFLSLLVDLAGDQQEFRSDEEDDRRDRGDASHESGDKAGQEGILDQRKRHCKKDSGGIGAHIVSGFLDRRINLPERGDTGPGTCRKASHDKNQNQDL